MPLLDSALGGYDRIPAALHAGLADDQYLFYNLGLLEIIFFPGTLAERFRRITALKRVVHRT